MELKDRLKKMLKEQYGIESDADFMEALEEQPGIDFGIFVNRQEGDARSA